MTPFATVSDMASMWRPLSEDEAERAAKLLEAVSDRLRVEAINRGLDLDCLIRQQPARASVAKSVTIDVTARVIMASTSGDPMTQASQSAGGYSFSGTYLSPGGGIHIKQKELAALGILQQRRRVVELYDGCV